MEHFNNKLNLFHIVSPDSKIILKRKRRCIGTKLWHDFVKKHRFTYLHIKTDSTQWLRISSKKQTAEGKLTYWRTDEYWVNEGITKVILTLNMDRVLLINDQGHERSISDRIPQIEHSGITEAGCFVRNDDEVCFNKSSHIIEPH